MAHAAASIKKVREAELDEKEKILERERKKQRKIPRERAERKRKVGGAPNPSLRSPPALHQLPGPTGASAWSAAGRGQMPAGAPGRTWPASPLSSVILPSPGACRLSLSRENAGGGRGTDDPVFLRSPAPRPGLSPSRPHRALPGNHRCSLFSPSPFWRSSVLGRSWERRCRELCLNS